MTGSQEKKILGVVFSLTLEGQEATAGAISDRLGLLKGTVEEALKKLVSTGLLDSSRSGFALTARGRRSLRVVFIGGGFEVIHTGHLYTIESARRLGDVLVVVVARDSTIRSRKRRDPVASEEERVKLLSALRLVDSAILGSEGDIYETLERVGPDVVALGYDQRHAEADIALEARKRGMAIEVVRLDAQNPRVKTSRLLNEL